MERKSFHMRSIVKRVCIVLIAALFFASASGAKPKLISETEAKKAGLAFINQVFGVNETEAVVALYTYDGAVYSNGDIQPSEKAEPVYSYQVAVMDKKTNDFRYAASVNAITGIAYKASMKYSLLPAITEQQRELAAAAETPGLDTPYDFNKVSANCYQATRAWIGKTFHPETPILGFVDRGFSMEGQARQMTMGFYTVMRDGTIYNIDMVWPQLQIYNFEILNQIGLCESDA
jgi:hypothetical protein